MAELEISIFLFNLYLREIIFVTDVEVLTIETTKLVFKPLDIFWRFWNTR